MKQTNSPVQKNETCFQSVQSAPLNRAQQTPVSETSKAIEKNRGLYQRELSKQITKLTKYSESGITHSNGTAATSWQSLFVVAKRSPEVAAGKRTHSTR